MASGIIPKPFYEVGKIYSKSLYEGSKYAHTISIPNGFRGMVFVTSNNILRCASAVVISYNSGNVFAQQISKGDNFIFDVSVVNELKWSYGKDTSGTDISGPCWVMVFSNSDDLDSVEFKLSS